MSNRNLRIRVLLEGADRLTRPMRDAAAGSSRLAQTLAATRNQLKALQRSQADIQEFRQLRSGTRALEQQMQQAQARTTALGRAIGQSTNPTRQMQREFAAARRESERLTNEHRQQSTRLTELRTRLAAAGISTRDLVNGERRLREQIRQTSDSMRDQDRRLQELTARTQRFADARARFSSIQGTATGTAAGGAAAIGTGLTIMRPLEGSADDAMQFESVMTDINQKVVQARDAGREMGLELRRSALAVNQMPQDLQRGVDALTGFGLGGQQAVDMMTPIGRTATAYKADIEDLSKATYATFDNLKVPIEQTGKALDVMAQAGKSGAFELKDMAKFYPQLTANLQALEHTGIPAVADLSAALQIARKGAGDAPQAANNLMNLLAKMNSEETIQNFRELGIDVPKALKRAVKESRSPLEEFIRLTEQATGGDQAKLAGLFGDMQVQQALRPLIANFEEYKAIRADAMGADGTVDADFAERMNDTAQKVQRLKIRMQDLSLTVGEKLLPLIAQGATKFSEIADRISAFAERHPDVIRGAAMAAAVLAALFLVVGGGAIILAAVIAPIGILAAAATALGIGLLPLIGIALLVVAGIAAIAAASYWLYENWGNWPKIAQGIVNGLKYVFLNFSPLAIFRRAFMPVLDYLRSINLADIGRHLIQGLIKGIGGAIPGLRAAIDVVGNLLPDSLRKTLGIHSPSRVFAEIGGYAMAGLDQGLGKNANAPLARINDLSARMTRALVVGAGAGAMATAAAPAAARDAARSSPPAVSAPAEFHLHFHGVTGDPAAIADAVRKAIEDLERERRGRTFSDE
ncbi:phage tail tape measure protein [Altererythrobacter xixiisoli]|uniref:Phage tail tape measure protein n=1 Tax=Croceibacterium xixiisoli TaxID=1476466 RepID=A0A6I4TWN7_9SPHN|nr:phage tail tape measure protein [Croceibacterium xixiisoli]MXP00447.1 phage tail tape measure protein [Croceibacterium xixiisoli]